MKLFLEFKKFKLAVESAYNPIFIVNPKGTIIYANKAARIVTGFSKKEMVGRNFSLLSGRSESLFYKKALEKAKIGKKIFEGKVEGKKKNGQEYPAEIRIVPVLGKGGKMLFFCLFRDLTKEIASEEFPEFVRQAPFSIQIFNPDGLCVNVNKAWEKVWSSEGRSDFVIGRYNILKDKQAEEIGLMEGIKRGFRGEIVYFPPFKYVVPELKSLVGESLEKFTPKFKRPEFVKYIQARMFPILDSKGKIRKVALFHEDVTKAYLTDKAKSEFISLASHQLRTPLSEIKWVVEMLRESGGSLSENQKKYLKDLSKATERIIQLVKDLLTIANISKIETAKVPKTDLGKLISSAAKEMRDRIGKKRKINFSLKTKKRSARVIPEIFSQAISNLLQNAADYGKPGSDIDIVLSSDKSNCIISVHNEGTAIPPSDQERIFTKFYRSQEAIKIKPEGSGLGLFIVKSIVEAHGGSAAFKSPAHKNGTGVTFYISIPIKPKE